jgi:hypothetical protein
MLKDFLPWISEDQNREVVELDNVWDWDKKIKHYFIKEPWFWDVPKRPTIDIQLNKIKCK